LYQTVISAGDGVFLMVAAMARRNRALAAGYTCIGGFGGLLSGVGNLFGGLGDRGALNRGALNAAMTHNVTGSASIDVNVAAPPGTHVAAKSKGLFKPVAMTRQTMMQHIQGGPHNVGDFEFGNA
jgi:hypothetical protein